MFAKSLILAASVAHMALAEQEFGLLNESGLTNIGARLLKNDNDSPYLKKRYFKSPAYMKKSAVTKLDELWS